MALATQFTIGTGALVLAMQGIWAVIGPTPPPIIVHSITYDAGMITQDRTITTAGPFKVVWEAAIIDAKTGRIVTGCSGSGAWDYPPGSLSPSFPVAEWVGNDACDLSPGVYVPMATYSAGEFRLVARGDAFEVTE